GTFVDDRLTAEFTYYHQRTTDALFEVSSIPSEGDWDDQLENVGELTNQGIELYLNAVAYQSRDFTAEAGVSVSTNKSEVVSLG
ncbi:MAG: TonB-dependent receptor, partial [Gemmatimonadetes bacterium]|nr:TonB-dependent receptor [Gemmatimonadota bacterium]NIR79860.1 TonB-dependent receptor [Gemmatimonadota bacterium]NIT88581.1 TonB-dependent receptor [Gemmatimonadota bacterium]NIU32400.1 TonB-dependent receptor [Gemmatimonadota bacterium]NIU36900.1 TonB-dependent receptor [Gemmatimonadota bacterium]